MTQGPPPVIRVAFFAVLTALITAGFWGVFMPPRREQVDRRIVSVALSRTGKWLAAGTSQGWITLWDQEHHGSPQRIDVRSGTLDDLRFSPDERLPAIANRELELWSLDGTTPLRRIRSDDQNYGTVRFRSDGQSILVITGRGTIETLDSRSGTTRLRLCCSTVYGEVAFSPDESLSINADHWPCLWDARSGELIARLTEHREFHTFRPIAFDEDRHLLFMGSQDGRVYAWDLDSRRLVATSPPQSGYVDTIAVLNNAGWIAYAGFGKIVHLWNPQTGEDRSMPSARPASNLVLEPDRSSIVFGTGAGVVEFWQIKEGRRSRTLRLPDQ